MARRLVRFLTSGRASVVSVRTERCEAVGERHFRHAIRNAEGCCLRAHSRFLARFFLSLTGPNERVLLGFYLMDGDPVDSVLETNWLLLKRAPGVSGRRSWVVGSTADDQKLAAIYGLARDYAFGDPVLIAVAPIRDVGDALYACHWDVGLGDEAVLLPFYHTVANTSHDPRQLVVVSKNLDGAAVVERLKAASSNTEIEIRREA